MQVKINSVQVEDVVKGRSKYQVAHVNYQQDGQAKDKKIMSFANPSVFADVQKFVGQDVDIKVVKNGQFWEWTNISGVSTGGGTTPAPAATNGSTRVTGSNYETKEERAARQVLIVKQSSLSAAVGSLTPGAKAPLDAQAVIDLAQKYTDWVFDNKQELEDIPY